MTELMEFMRPPDGEVIRSTVVFSRKVYNEQRAAQGNDVWIEGPVGEKQNRVLRKDILWSPRPGRGLGRNERAAVHKDVDVFSVLNNIGKGFWSKAHFLQNYYYVGLSTSTMESNAINTDAGIYSAVDRQGLTWIRNTGDVTIQVGDLVMAELPDGTPEAVRIFPADRPTEGGTPSRRYTAFPATWSVGIGTKISKADVHKALRGDRREPASMGTSATVVLALRKIIAMGVLVVNKDPDQPMPAFLADVVGRVDANSIALDDGFNGILDGDVDADIARLLFPDGPDLLVPGGRTRGLNDSTKRLNNIQREGYSGLITALYGSIQESGANRIMGKAISGALPGEVMSILLFG